MEQNIKQKTEDTFLIKSNICLLEHGFCISLSIPYIDVVTCWRKRYAMHNTIPITLLYTLTKCSCLYLTKLCVCTYQMDASSVMYYEFVDGNQYIAFFLFK